MRILVAVGKSPVLIEEDDFKRLSVVASNLLPPEAGKHLGSLGEADGPGHVRLAVEELRKLGGFAAADESNRRFDEMIAYARSKGWIDEHNRVRAHVE